MGYSTIDDTVGSDAVKVLLPDTYAGYSVVYHHGVGEDASSLTSDTLKAGVLAQMLADGYMVSSTDGGGQNWGNQAGLDSYLALDAYLASNHAPTKTVVFSQSMGGCTGLLTVASNKITTLKGWFGIYPVCSLANMFGSNAGTFASAIRTAFGIASDGSDYSTKTSGHDALLKSAGAFAGIAMRFYASPDDTVVAKTANTDAFHSLVSGVTPESAVIVCSGDHGDPSHFQPSDLAAFLARTFAIQPSISWRSV